MTRSRMTDEQALQKLEELDPATAKLFERSALSDIENAVADRMTAERIEAFWSVARHQARTGPVPGGLGTSAEGSLVPPAWAFGATPTEADGLIALVIGGTKTATAGALWDFEHEDESLPRVGDVVILLDGSQRPRVLIEVTQVEVVPFDEVGEEHARLEAEGDLSLAHWRDVHERFFAGVATHGRGFVRSMPVVLQRFKVLYAR